MSNNSNFDTLATTIITLLGGKENLEFVNHCATRLRVNVRDLSRVNQDGLKSTKGVLGLSVQESSKEVQVIIGQTIEDVFSDSDKNKIGINSEDYNNEKAFYSLEALKKIENGEFEYDKETIERFDKIFQLFEK